MAVKTDDLADTEWEVVTFAMQDSIVGIEEMAVSHEITS